MATATHDGPTDRGEAEADAHADARWSNEGGSLTGRHDYRCVCGHTLRVFGSGRHRIYFEPENRRLDDPLMVRICPACGRELPTSNRRTRPADGPTSDPDSGPETELL